MVKFILEVSIGGGGGVIGPWSIYVIIVCIMAVDLTLIR